MTKTKLRCDQWCLQVSFIVLTIWAIGVQLFIQFILPLLVPQSRIDDRSLPLKSLIELAHTFLDYARSKGFSVFLADTDLLPLVGNGTVLSTALEMMPDKVRVVFGAKDYLNCSDMAGLRSWSCVDLGAEFYLTPLCRNFVDCIPITLSLVYFRPLTVGDSLRYFVAPAPGDNSRQRLIANLSLRKMPITCRKLQIPVTIPAFLHDYTSSNFIPCNQTAVEHFYRQYTDQKRIADSQEAAHFRRSARQILKSVDEALNPISVPFWLSSGTCLGWYRQCDTIVYSQDVDIGIWATDYRDDIVSRLEDAGFQLKMKLGFPEDSLQLAFYKNGIKLDIYFFYSMENHSPESQPETVWNAATKPETGERYRYTFANFDLCWTLFLGLKLRVPCDPVQYLTANYGADWATPVTQWSWNQSPPNVQPYGVWPEQIRSEAVQVFEIFL